MREQTELGGNAGGLLVAERDTSRRWVKTITLDELKQAILDWKPDELSHEDAIRLAMDVYSDEDYGEWRRED